MRQRVREFGGEFRVSNANPGTLVEVVIPSTASSQEWRALPPGSDDRNSQKMTGVSHWGMAGRRHKDTCPETLEQKAFNREGR